MKNNFKTLEELLKKYPERRLGKATNLKGKKINRVTPICRVEYSSSSAYWACKCECGTYFISRGTHLTQNVIKSCGCYSKEINHTKNRIYLPNHQDLTGEKFGNLTAVEYYGNDSNNHAKWRCLCDCGKYTIVTATHLKTGHSRSCGCNKESKYETYVSEWLDKNKIKYKREVIIPELGKLRFDFQIFYNNQMLFLEVQGQQHFSPVDKFGGEKYFKTLQNNDNKKREYCRINNIILLEIKYSDDIKLILENFFLTKKFND